MMSTRTKNQKLLCKLRNEIVKKITNAKIVIKKLLLTADENAYKKQLLICVTEIEIIEKRLMLAMLECDKDDN